MKKLLLIVFGVLLSVSIIAQHTPKSPPIAIDQTTYTIEQLIEEVLINGCVDAFNITHSSDATSFAYFEENGSGFPFEAGFVMVTGSASTAVGPNSSSGAGNDNGLGSDPQLAAIASNSVHNATILEFDFIPSSDTIRFNYIFGSEEYNEYANTSYNDVFGFFLSGGPEGYSNVNIALIPGTSTPVAINNVNWGNSYSPITSPLWDAVNPSYYYENSGGDDIEFDGRTLVLEAMAIVTPCETYHIKLAVGDCGDGVLDSGVFLEAGSFDSGGNVLMENPDPIYGANNEIYEGCFNYYVFSRLDQSAEALLDSVQVLLSYGGPASYGVDYTALPSSIWISAGDIYDTIWFEAFNDGVGEPVEYFTIDLLSGCPCSLESVSDTIWILDFIVFKAGVTPNDLRYCDGEVPDSIMIRGYSDSHPSDFLYYQWSNGVVGQTDSIIWVVPSPGYNIYYATISDLCDNSVTDSCIIVVSDLSATTFEYANYALCWNDCLGEMHVSPDGVSPPFTMNWEFSASGTPAPTEDMYGLCRGFYYLRVTDNVGCYLDYSFHIVDPDLLELNYIDVSPDYSGCSGTATPNVTGGTPPYSYTWSSGASGSPATGLCYGIHYVTITDANGCSTSDMFLIDDFTSVNQISNNNNIKIYPNPSHSGNVTIELEYSNSNMVVELVDLTGRIVNSEEIPGKTIMYVLRNIPNGTYLLRVKNDNKLVHQQRIMINK
ncbi:MAG: choice-of-anchor L domain-containing protein [Bacteroidales bacterium]|nr:choice-of-anchor L domain-containing protein [Bacteroidales bacterium]